MSTKTPKTKKCGRCGKARPIDQFSLYADSKDGRNAWDRACLAEYAAEKRAWHDALDALNVAKDERRGIAQALRLGLTAPIEAAAKVAKERTRRAAPRKSAART